MKIFIKYFVLFFICFFGLLLTVKAQRQIRTVEFWTNNNYNDRTKRELTAAKTYNWEELIDYASLPDGVHTFNARFADNGGVWSNVQSHFFLKTTNAAGMSAARKVSKIEFWTNNGYNNSIKRGLAGTETYNWEELIDYASLPDGVHTFNARFADDGGVWSNVQSHFFLKTTNAAGMSAARKVSKIEFWTNNCYNNSIKRGLAGTETYNWEELIDYASLPDGVHTFNARFADDSGVWSNVQSHFFIKNKRQITEINKNQIAGYRLWFAKAPGFTNNFPVHAAQNIAEIQDSISVGYLPKGKHHIAYQFKDLHGIWSPVISDSVTQTGIPQFSFRTENREYKQGDTVKFIPSTNHFIDSIAWNYGDGMTEVSFEPIHRYDSIGTFDVTATVWHLGATEGISYVELKYITIVSTGITQPEIHTLRIFPVPATDEITIESETAIMKTIRIASMSGIVSHQAKPESPGKTTFKIGHLVPGNYIVIIETDKGIISGKIIKKLSKP